MIRELNKIDYCNQLLSPCYKKSWRKKKKKKHNYVVKRL